MLEFFFENFLSFFLGIKQFQAHFLIKVFLIKKRVLEISQAECVTNRRADRQKLIYRLVSIIKEKLVV